MILVKIISELPVHCDLSYTYITKILSFISVLRVRFVYNNSKKHLEMKLKQRIKPAAAVVSLVS